MKECEYNFRFEIWINLKHKIKKDITVNIFAALQKLILQKLLLNYLLHAKFRN